jgi:hypothetical protein
MQVGVGRACAPLHRAVHIDHGKFLVTAGELSAFDKLQGGRKWVQWAPPNPQCSNPRSGPNALPYRTLNVCYQYLPTVHCT